AFSCYHQHLGGTLEAMLPFGDSPECGDIPADWKDKIMHARLVVGSFALMASDNHPAYPYEGIKGCSISLNVDSKAEAERLFTALAEGGSVQMPLGPTFWAASFGMFTDRFGVAWMVNCEQDR
ncbi:VOC family protein, partial [Pseudomonas aeruginosa]